MFSRFGLLAIVCFVVTFSGCVTQTRVNTVPWWKGLPCMVVAPSSIEAHVWRQHLHGADCQDACLAGESCSCDSCFDEPLEGFDPSWDSDSPPPQPEVASPPVESDHVADESGA